MKKVQKQQSRRLRIRSKVKAVAKRPILSVKRSNKYISGQILDGNKVVLSFSDKNVEKLTGTKTQRAAIIGEEMAKKAKAKKISKIAFDRGGYRYHGRVKAFVEGLRKGGLDF